MPRVMIYRFTAYSHSQGDVLESRRMGTHEAIKEVHGKAIEGTGIEIDDSLLDLRMDGFTLKDFVP